jgi:hypothetical protein
MRKWRLRHLMISWFGYWAGIAAIKLGPAMAAGWVASRGPQDGTSSINVNWDIAAGIGAVIKSRGEVIWTGASSITAIIGWIVIPPLLMWIVWLKFGGPTVPNAGQIDALHAGDVRDETIRKAKTTLHDRR